MQDLEDDMDELIRKASKDYPFRLQEDAWDFVASKIESVRKEKCLSETVGVPAYNRKKILLSILAFLITAFFFSVYEMHPQEIQRNRDGYKSDHPAFTGERNVKLIRDLKKSKSTRPAHYFYQIGGFYEKTEDFQGIAIRASDVKYRKKRENEGREIIRQKTVLPPFHPMRLEFLTACSRESAKIDLNKRKTWFYLGVTAGPQFSEVRDQGFSSPGWSMGLLAGLRLGNKLSLESGINFSVKQYHTSGKYFNLQKISGAMPQGMELISMQGKSNVLEIPFMLKYDVMAVNKGRIFVSAGISSYILTKEANQYLAVVNGTRQNMSGNYTKSSNYYTASANFSVGYEYHTGNGIKVGLAPYLQIPMANFGVGSLPILSTGINLRISIPVIKK